MNCDALVVGGGPAGSTCAGALRRAGWDVVLVDRATFPRDKVCAGWITPEAFALLELEPREYENAGLTLQPITAFRTALMADGSASELETRYDEVVSYAIRRVEFDRFLLDRARVRRVEHTPVVKLRRDQALWVVNDTFRAPVLIGAGGHFCPVARYLRGEHARERPVVAKEAEVRRDRGARLSDVPSLFFSTDLDGYGWCVPKGEYVNVGIGHRDHRVLAAEFGRFLDLLDRRQVVPDARKLPWHGHAYLASGAGGRPIVGDGVLLVGDAAGLAYPTSGEGITPAIASALLAAHTLIEAAPPYVRATLQPYVEAVSRTHPRVAPIPAALAAIRRPIGRLLLSSPFFTRHVVLDRWFLRRASTQVSS
jgi:geranylgeranyl reductase family protein